MSVRRTRNQGHLPSREETLLAILGAPVLSRESPEEQARRAWMERQQTFKDREEDFVRVKAAATTREERRALSQDFAEYRRAHREKDVTAGRRAAGLPIGMHQIMWAPWAEVAVEHNSLPAKRSRASLPTPSQPPSLRTSEPRSSRSPAPRTPSRPCTATSTT